MRRVTLLYSRSSATDCASLFMGRIIGACFCGSHQASPEATMTRVWKISPGEGARAWRECLERQCIVMGWKRLRNYQRFGNDRDAVAAFLGGGYGNGRGAATSILRFAYDIKKGDIVV